MVNEYALKRALCGFIIAIFLSTPIFLTALLGDQAYATPSCSTADDVTTCTDGTTFNVNVNETLSVSLTPVTTNASGDTGTFLRNLVSLNVTSNNGAGFVAYMTTKTSNTSLSNILSDATIPTLTSGGWTRASSTTNFWGYSINDDAEAGSYNPMVGSSSASPIQLANSTTSTSASGVSQNVYFGAKIDGSKASGTYTGTVVFTIVSGISTVPASNPTDPAGPQDTSEHNPVVAYDDTGEQKTVYTSVSGDTTTTEISAGNQIDNYSSATEVTYTPPQGVTTSTDINAGTPLATVLAVAAGVAATAGFIFLAVAKRKKDDDEEDEL